MLIFLSLRWTGSDNNPRNNAGQGRAGTDRSNIVLLAESPYGDFKADAGQKNGHWGRNYPANVTDKAFLGLPLEDLRSLASSGSMWKFYKQELRSAFS